MSTSMAEGIRKAMRDHQVSWKADLADEVFVAHCTSCGYLGSELEDWEHQANIAAEVLAANGYGKLPLSRRQSSRDVGKLIKSAKTNAWDEGYLAGRVDERTACEQINPYRRPE